MRWRLWAGRRDRLALALLGIVVLAAGLALIATLTDSIRGTVTRAYEQTWRAPYDILVHMPLSDGATLADVTEPNVLTTLPAGITVQQWQEISRLAGVQVAAPVAVVGYVRAGPTYAFPSDALPGGGPGLYRVTTQVTTAASGVNEALTEQVTVAVADKATGQKPAWIPADTFVIDYRRVPGITVDAQIPTFLVGIDPAAEEQLTGLSRAVTGGNGLLSGEKIRSFELKFEGGNLPSTPVSVIPVIVNQGGLRDLTYTVTVEELNQEGRVQRVVTRKTWAGPELADGLRLGEGQYQRLLGQSGPLRYAATPSPYPDRWPLAFKLAVAAGDVRASFPPDTADRQNALQLGPVLRSWQPTGDRGQYQYQVRGYFDPARLSVALDPRSQMPLMTYRPAEATRVLDQAGRPVNPPQLLSGGLSPVSFLSAPPVLLTTMEGAVALAGDRAINAIQIKAKDAEHFTPETVARVQALAAEIERRTGLVAEVTMGSSPVGVLVQVPDRGWVEELWIHKNASVTTVQQVEFGYSSYAVLLIAVAALYTVVTALTGVNARRRELGVTIALGWPDRAMRSMVMGEQLLFALLAGALAALAATLAHAPPTMILVVLGLAVLIYLPAIWLSGLVAVRTAPGEALRWGDTAPGRRVLGGAGVVPLALSSLLGRPGRTLLTVVAIALPTALLILLTFIGRYLRGVLYTTITGQYAAMRVGPVQYAAGIVALAVAAVTAFDLIRQNAIDHRSERALLHALGWPQRWIAATMVAEGTLLGLAAGIAGELFGILLLALLYGFKVAGVAQIAAVAWLLPVLLGCLTGLASTLVEFRSWNRAGLAAVRPEEVSRSGRGYRVVGVTMLLVLLGCVGGLAIYRWAGEWQARRAVGPSVGERTESAIAAVVAQQNGALADLDLNAYQATLDPANPPYVTEEQHWLEDARTWKALNPGGRITRTVAKVQLLGDNTANVWIRQQLEDAKPASSVLETVWTRSAEGQWREYGRQHLVLQEGNLTLWYPPSVPEATARRVLTAAQNDLDTLRRMGYTLPESQLFELFANEDAFRDSLGPYLAGAGVAQVWVEVGEPLRFYMNDSLPNFAYHLLTVAAITQTHNQAPLWLREGIRLYGDAAMGGLSVQDEIRRFPAVPLLPPTQLGSIPGNVDRNADSYAQVSISGMAFVWYLQETYGPQTVKQICDALAREPLDLRLEGPETDAQRIRLAEQAVEQVTGQRLADLSEQFERWARTLEVKR